MGTRSRAPSSSSVVTNSLPKLDLPPGNLNQRYPSSVPAWARPKSPTPSQRSRSSRQSSPDSVHKGIRTREDASEEDEEDVLALSAGCQPDEVYKASLPRWRYNLRRRLVRGVEVESPILARIQTRARHPFWDSYFIWSSILGTHSAFMVGLPLFYWFGYTQTARGLVNILAFGVYSSSVIKDLLCVPRPYTPPVERLSISSHGLEYGFPSTHSTNAVSISLYFAQLYLQSRGSTDFTAMDALVVALCGIYAASVVLGRVYCGMHSMTDCLAGTLLGTCIWYGHMLLSPHMESFLQKEGSTVLSVVIPLALGLVIIHPEPVDDCPCFEDVIAFVATAAGIAMGGWRDAAIGRPAGLTRGSLVLDMDHVDGLGLWLACAAAKTALGIGIILTWRIAAKKTLHVILPSLFTLFRPVIELPRRHYQRATGYKEVETSNPIHAVPSVLDLTGLGSTALEVPGSDYPDSSTEPSPTSPNFSSTQSLHPHHLHVVGTASTRPREAGTTEKRSKSSQPPVRELKQVHYDIDVLTKLGVYCGIGLLASTLLPSFFSFIGLDV